MHRRAMRARNWLGSFIRFLCSPLRRIGASTCRVTYYPAFDSQEELTSHFYRACWYLPFSASRCEEVVLAHTLAVGTPDAPPSGMAAPDGKPPPHIRMLRGSIGLLRALLTSRLVIFWKTPPPRGLHRIAHLVLDTRIVYVATRDPSSMEYGTYAGLMWRHLTPIQHREAILKDSADRFRTLAAELAERRFCAACVFGTGPTLAHAYDFDFRKALCIVCNSIVQDEELLDHVQPTFVCAGDVVSHFGVSKYAAQFRVDLIRALRGRNMYLFTTATFGHLLLEHYPELSGRVYLSEQRVNSPVFDLMRQFELPMFESTLNIHMLPLAATFSRVILLLGCDGKLPVGDNEDFWAHAASAQYGSLVRSGHECHPTFDISRQRSTYGRYLQSIDQSITDGEARGNRYKSLARSFVPTLASRQLDIDRLESMGLSKPYPIAALAQIVVAERSGRQGTR